MWQFKTNTFDKVRVDTADTCLRFEHRLAANNSQVGSYCQLTLTGRQTNVASHLTLATCRRVNISLR